MIATVGMTMIAVVAMRSAAAKTAPAKAAEKTAKVPAQTAGTEGAAQ
jgi:hypothetical protein